MGGICSTTAHRRRQARQGNGNGKADAHTLRSRLHSPRRSRGPRQDKKINGMFTLEYLSIYPGIYMCLMDARSPLLTMDGDVSYKSPTACRTVSETQPPPCRPIHDRSRFSPHYPAFVRAVYSTNHSGRFPPARVKKKRGLGGSALRFQTKKKGGRPGARRSSPIIQPETCCEWPSTTATATATATGCITQSEVTPFLSAPAGR